MRLYTLTVLQVITVRDITVLNPAHFLIKDKMLNCEVTKIFEMYFCLRLTQETSILIIKRDLLTRRIQVMIRKAFIDNPFACCLK